jgi:hypothetical protein
VLVRAQVFEYPLFQIHVLGKPAEGDLARPFKAAAANPLQQMMGELTGPEETKEGEGTAAIEEKKDGDEKEKKSGKKERKKDK